MFSSRRTGEWGLYWKRADGTGDAEELVTRPGVSRLVAMAWSPGGDTLVFMETSPDTGTDLATLSLRAAERPVEFLIRTHFNEGFSSISPDGGWITYASDKSGDWEIHMERFPELGEHHQLSADGGLYPLWSRRGDEVFYLSRRGRQVLSVPVREILNQDEPAGTVAAVPTGPTDHQQPSAVERGVIGPGRAGDWLDELERQVPTR